MCPAIGLSVDFAKICGITPPTAKWDFGVKKLLFRSHYAQSKSGVIALGSLILSVFDVDISPLDALVTIRVSWLSAGGKTSGLLPMSACTSDGSGFQGSKSLLLAYSQSPRVPSGGAEVSSAT